MVSAEYVPTDARLANVLTKILSAPRMLTLQEKIGLV
uniref:Uncharacterized protein n=1 Tax=Peronospora matthiolae TaxID=2874970 RepID=A0AAV1TJ93_9STRA